MSEIRFIDADAVHDGLPWNELIEALRVAHRGVRPETGRLFMDVDGDGLLILPGWSARRSIGIKLVTIFPENRDRGLASVQALYLMFDGEVGRPLAAVDGTALTYRKTAADSALGAAILARPGVDTMTMVGAGGLAPFLVEAHRAAHPSIERVFVWNRTTRSATALAQTIDGGEAVDDLAGAVTASGLVSCATMSDVPLVKGAWLTPGSHVDLVGAYQPHMRESDDEVMRRGRIFVDNPETTVEEAGDLLFPLESGAITADDVLGDLFDLCTGRVDGRVSSTDITVFKNGGGAHLDLMTASLLLDQR